MSRPTPGYEAPAPARDWAVFASRLAADWLATDPTSQHRRTRGCLVSADLSGFTAMSERFASQGRRGAEMLTEVVNGSFTALIDAAGREGGDVLKFGGDALLLWFDGEQAALRAARASVRMQRALAAARFARVGLRMSVGAHHGEFDFFLVGEPDWRELVLLGPGVTRTVELESASDPGQVLVSQELADELPDEWLSRQVSGHHALRLEALPLPRREHVSAMPPTAQALVPPNLREDISALATLGGEHRLATVAFLEIEGTDATLEQFGPEAMTRRLDDLIRATQRISHGYGVQFLYTDVIADGLKLIATCGAPTTTSKDEESALRYALDFVHGDATPRLKCGVNRGRVFAGFLGSATRRTYTVMGDPVNLAARLMAHARPGQVVATVETIEASTCRFATTALAPFLVKGKTQPIHAVIVHEATSGPHAPVVTELPMIGRQNELSQMHGWVTEVIAGQGRSIELVGEAGVGKTRLISEVARDERIAIRVVVTCQPYDTNTAYAAARALLRRVLGIPFEEAADRAGQTLTSAVARVRPELLPLVPLIADVLDADVPPTPEAAAIASEFRVARTHDAVVDLLTALLAMPTMLLIEDGYYADPASLALFRALAEALVTRPWLLLVTRRPENPALFAGAGRGESLLLEALEPSDAAELAAVALVDRPELTGQLGAMTKRSGGNPLFILQLSQAVRAGVATDDLPESVERVVAARLDRLAPAERTMLRLAAVLGPRFDVALLHQVLSEQGQPPPDETTWERVQDLVEEDGDTQRRFRHVLYRDVAYGGLPFRRRTHLHQRVGEILENQPGPLEVGLLAEHFFRAGDYERTWTYSVAAGDEAWASLAVSEASVAYERALAVRRRLRSIRPEDVARVAEALGDVLERSGRFDESDRRYLVAGRLVGESDAAVPRLLRKRGVLRERAGRYKDALRWYDRGRAAVAVVSDPGAEAPLLVAAAGVMHRLGRTDEQVRLASAAVDKAALAGDLSTEAHACLSIQTALTHAGDLENLQYGTRALTLFTQLGSVLFQGKVHNNLGVARYFHGDWTEAAEHYALAADRFDAAGDVVEAATARNNLGEVLSDQGSPEPALTYFAGALAAWRKADYPLGCAIAQANIGRALARAGDCPRAVQALTEAAVEFEGLGTELFLIETRIRLAEAHLLAGDVAAALPLIDSVEPAVAAGGGFPGSDAAVLRLRCWQQQQLGDAGAALAFAHESVARAAAGGARFERALALNEVSRLSHDPKVAIEVTEELAALGVLRLPALPVLL